MKKSSVTPISNRGLTGQILDNIPHAEPLLLENLVASIDSLRIKFEYSATEYDFEKRQTVNTVDHILEWLDSVQFWQDNQIDTEAYHSDFKLGNYRHTLIFKEKGGASFAILAGRFCCESSKKQIAPEIVLDVNPNKVTTDLWHYVARILLAKAYKVSLQRFDLALDLPINRNLLHMSPRSRSKYTRIDSTLDQEIIKGFSRTEYQGNRQKHGAVKLYDKSYEIRIDNPSIAEFDCSRIEITIVPQKYKGLSPLLPDVYSDAPLQLSDEFENLEFCVKAMILHPDLIPIYRKTVSRHTFYKYKPYIEKVGRESISIDDEKIKKIEKYIETTISKFNSRSGLEKLLFA